MTFYDTIEERRDAECWLDREGKIHKYNPLPDEKVYDVVSYHYQIAQSLYPDSNRPEDILNRMGWIPLGKIGRPDTAICERKPSQSQINVLFDMGFTKMRTVSGVGSDGFGEMFLFELQCELRRVPQNK